MLKRGVQKKFLEELSKGEQMVIVKKKEGNLMKDCKGIWGRKNNLLIKMACCRRFGARF